MNKLEFYIYFRGLLDEFVKLAPLCDKAGLNRLNTFHQIRRLDYLLKQAESSPDQNKIIAKIKKKLEKFPILEFHDKLKILLRFPEEIKDE